MGGQVYGRLTVSHLWRNQIQAFFAPEQVDLVGLRRGMRPIQVVRLAALCEQFPDLPVWEGALQKLDLKKLTIEFK